MLSSVYIAFDSKLGVNVDTQKLKLSHPISAGVEDSAIPAVIESVVVAVVNISFKVYLLIC